MKKIKKISVIIPIYNVEKYLENCIDSIINQTYKNIEIILIDDGSKDDSLIIANKYKNKYNNIIVISKPNGGQGSARNKGLELATGDYISFIDSDDEVSPLMFECMIFYAEKYNLDIVECSYQEFTLNKKGHIYKSKAEEKKVYSGIEYYEHYPILSPCNKIYNTRFLNRVNFSCTENKYAEDAYDITYLILKAEKIMRIDECLYYYRRDNINSTRNNGNIAHKIKLGMDKLYISNKLNNLKNELNVNGYISNVIVRNIIGAIFKKAYLINKLYRTHINNYIKEHNIKQTFKENVNVKILFVLLKTFILKKILKIDQ